MNVQFLGYNCSVTITKYPNGSPKLQLMADSLPVCTATTNVPNLTVPTGCVLIKDYAENNGVLDALIVAGIVSVPLSKVNTGYTTVNICKLLS